MSFSYNPFLHVDLIKAENGRWFVHCHGCGWDSLRAGFTIDPVFDTLHLLLIKMDEHIRISHSRASTDFEGWGKY